LARRSGQPGDRLPVAFLDRRPDAINPGGLGAEPPESSQAAAPVPFPPDPHALSHGKLQRWPILQPAVRSLSVVFPDIQPGQCPGVVHMMEHLLVQELIPQRAVDPLVPPVLPG